MTDAPPPSTEYERNQSFNRLVRFLHDTRYRHLIALFESMSASRPLKVVDIGCAHAKAYGILDRRFAIDYVGIELDAGFAAVAHQRYRARPNVRIVHGSIADHLAELDGADVVLALETFEHIPEHLVVRVVEKIASVRPVRFMCSVPNEVGPIVWVKNLGSAAMGYARHTEYTWRETLLAGLYRLDDIAPHGVGHKGFDWRWLAQTLRHNLKIARTFSNPFDWLPRTLSASLIFVCEPR